MTLSARYPLSSIALLILLSVSGTQASRAQQPSKDLQIDCGPPLMQHARTPGAMSFRSRGDLGRLALPDNRLQRMDSLAESQQSILGQMLKDQFGVQRVIAPWLTGGSVVVGRTRLDLPIQKQEVERCRSAALRLNQEKESLKSAAYLCSLITVDNSCLTSFESQPHVPDPGIPRRSLVALVAEGLPFCSGLLTDEQTLITARHCFIDRISGLTANPLKAVDSGTIGFESIDGMRIGNIDVASLRTLELGRGYDIDEDFVSIPVVVEKKAGAGSLPAVVRVDATAIDQALWIAGPVNHLAVALSAASPLMRSDAWQENVRWSRFLGAQCRTVAVSNDCIYHSCQTFKGFSGTPLITGVYWRDGRDVIEYAGIHSGTPGDKAPGFRKCAVSRPGFNADEFRMYNVGNHSR